MHMLRGSVIKCGWNQELLSTSLPHKYMYGVVMPERYYLDIINSNESSGNVDIIG